MTFAKNHAIMITETGTVNPYKTRKGNTMTINNNYSAASLYNGGWRADDKADLMEEYYLTESEADEICKELAEIEAETK